MPSDSEIKAEMERYEKRFREDLTPQKRVCQNLVGVFDVKMGNLTKNTTSTGLIGLPSRTPMWAEQRESTGGFGRLRQNFDTPKKNQKRPSLAPY